ncbi:hypothetical protein [Caballeronia mineralivorans]|jgi:hypothetical protein|uniref:hypothetical protein n=1 Tax=Caballeronia mineralivorans TaxID=2010198 RepID=UPI0023F46E47|nr:hypothetical protein [Caballeronia mineralivorans]
MAQVALHSRYSPHWFSYLTNVAIAGGAPAKSCNMCLKTGLPILPVRYSAVAQTRAHALDGVPVLMGGHFGAHVLDT